MAAPHTVPANREDFYHGKTIGEIEWWVSHCTLPELLWARLRVFSDGTADVCFVPDGTLCGFDARHYAEYFLGEDEYTKLASLDTDDEREYGITLASIHPPIWEDMGEQPFHYWGTY